MKVMTFCPQEAIRILYASGVISRAIVNRPQASGTLYNLHMR